MSLPIGARVLESVCVFVQKLPVNTLRKSIGDSLMKLTRREIELISNIEHSRLRRRRFAWIGLVSALVVLTAASYFDWSSSELYMVIGLLLGSAAWSVDRAYSAVRIDDKLNDLLLRYVRSDPEALRQLSSGQDHSTPQGQQKSI